MRHNLSIFNFKRLPKACILAIVLIGIFHFIELFIIPVNWFSFRPWEALRISPEGFEEKEFTSVYPGPFYPNIELSMVEVGPTFRYSPRYSVKEKVYWKTDEYGFRHENNVNVNYDFVLIGDSQMVGSHLSQDDMIEKRVEKKINRNGYTFAPGDVNAFLSTERFLQNKPKVVVYSSVEYMLYKIPEIKKYRLGFFSKIIKRNYYLYSIAISYHRFLKNTMGRYLCARVSYIRRKNIISEMIIKYFENDGVSKEKRYKDRPLMGFKKYVESLREYTREDVTRTARIIKSYSDEIEKQGMKFVFMAVPDKRSVYNNQSNFLNDLSAQLKELDVEVIDLLSIFRNVFQNQRLLLYYFDDSHLDKNGAEIISYLVSKYFIDNKVF